MSTDLTSLTGIKPTGTPHLGNYLGAILPALKLAENHRCFYFIADYHALTTVRSADELKKYVYDVAATWLACGLDTERHYFYRQSAIPEVFELMWVFACLLATGQLERSHAYKDALDKGEAPNAGLFNYPVLQAADIVLYDAHVVPVGKDQKQHIELARDVALRFNHVYGENLVVVPEPKIQSEVQVLGTDGQKMSKSYGNTLPLFASKDELKNAVMKIKTSSESLEAAKQADGSIVFELFKMVSSDADTQVLRDKLLKGGYGWGHAKMDLVNALEHKLGPMRERYQSLRADEMGLEHILKQGEDRARTIAHATMKRVRKAIGTLSCV